MNSWITRTVFALILLAAVPALADESVSENGLPPALSETVDFVKQIQPLFEDRCVVCHGASSQKGGFRLDRKQEALDGGGHGKAILPGDSLHSPLIWMTAGVGGRPRMPAMGEPLTKDQVALLRAWIDQGAPWPDDGAVPDKAAHWAFQPRSNPNPPDVKNTSWVINPIDRFVLAKLESEGVEPSPEADRSTLIRRLSLDLLGLIPSPDEVAAFEADSSPGAYEKLVDRLLASPHFGERWGRHWLDLARYADSDGYEKDLPRPYAWLYRDWVINAINDDMPFDEFTIEQLAGDLLPNHTLSQRIATGFNRNTLTNREGGIDPEEDRVKQVKDRTNTTGLAWLGLTVGCAECHNHKYDPISQREYYSLTAFFNEAEEKDVPAPKPEDVRAYEKKKALFDVVQDRVEDALKAYDKNEFPERFREWLAAAEPPSVRWEPLEPSAFLSVSGATHEVKDGVIAVGGVRAATDDYDIELSVPLKKVAAILLESVPAANMPKNGAGRADNGNFVVSEIAVFAGKDGSWRSLKLAEASADSEQEKYPAAGAIDGEPETGWSVDNEYGRSHRLLVKFTEPAILADDESLRVELKQRYEKYHTLGSFHLYASGVNDPGKADGMPVEIGRALRLNANERSEAQLVQLMDYFRELDEVRRPLRRAVDEHKKNAPAYPPAKAMTLAQNPDPPESHIMIRGDFLRPGDAVEPQTLAVLPALNSRGEKPDRLDLARWIVSRKNPLTARVAANRVWQYLFGEGLVRTPEDFGTRGEKPTHPELLDWLADRYIDQGWSRKALIKTIVMSSTYRQASRERMDLAERDPQNRLLARQFRYRLSAETIRDVSLKAGGLLNEAVGGPSIRPPLPADVAALGYAGSVKWNQSPGDEIYRRGLYIFFQRTVPYPMLMTFDCPDSNVACIQRNRSNTPLQALTMLNDPVFFECAQSLGRALASRRDMDTPARLDLAFKFCLSRAPSERECNRLGRLFNEAYMIARSNPDEANSMTGGVSPEGVKPAETAAWIACARTLMNLEEFMTRE
ncbi:MAG: DUF1549 domain-containing protein [bacterium]|nr:DUF1549 domain-containing protein [bacterium]